MKASSFQLIAGCILMVSCSRGNEANQSDSSIYIGESGEVNIIVVDNDSARNDNVPVLRGFRIVL